MPRGSKPCEQQLLEKAIDALGTGDILIVAEWDRATRSMTHGIAIIECIAGHGALIKVLDKLHLDRGLPGPAIVEPATRPANARDRS
jgi:DNA invertase Pin-like site-specific DNA recombinase